MELTKEEKQLKESMKILLRDGRTGRLFVAARDRYLALKTDGRINNLVHEIDINWTKNYTDDVTEIEKIIK